MVDLNSQIDAFERLCGLWRVSQERRHNSGNLCGSNNISMWCFYRIGCVISKEKKRKIETWFLVSYNLGWILNFFQFSASWLTFVRRTPSQEYSQKISGTNCQKPFAFGDGMEHDLENWLLTVSRTTSWSNAAKYSLIFQVRS